MSRLAFHKIALAGVLISGAQFLAQAQTTTVAGSAVTSGIVGVASGETAQLNVLNLQTASVSASAVAFPPCSATLEFFDNTNKLLQSSGVITITPGTSASMTLTAKLTPASVTGRQEIRAVVVTPTIIATPVAVTTAPVSASCSLMPSLEIYDSTGTRVFTTDFRPMLVSGPQPASTVK